MADDETTPVATRTGPRTDRIVGPELRSRWTTPRFGAITPERLSSILKSADDGRTEDWANFCEYLVEDADLFGIYHTRRNAVAGAPWDLEPGYSPDPAAQKWAAPAAVFCERAMREMADLERTWLDALDAIGVGWSAQESLWKRDAGAWVIGDFEWTRSARLRFDDAWKLRIYDGGQHGADGIELPPGKFLVHVPRSRASYPVRSGEFRTIAWYWLFHRWCIKYWLAAAERHGAPFLVGKVPEKTRADVKRAVRDKLEAMRNDGVAVIDAEATVELLESALSGAEVFDTLCSRFERGYAKALLGATLTVDVGDSGSRALGTEHGKVRLERSQGDARFLAGSWKRDVLYWLCWHNRHLFGGVMPPVPTLRIRPEGDVRKISDKLIDAGGVTYDEARAADGLAPWGPEKGGDQRIPAASAAQAPWGGQGAPQAPAPAAAAPAPAPAGGAPPPPFGRAPSTPSASATPSLANRERASSDPPSPTTSAPPSPTTPTSSRSPMSPLARALLGGSDAPKS